MFPVTFLRLTDDIVQLYRIMWIQKYAGVGPQLYHLRNADVKRLVPPETLLVYDVKQGFEPLCNFLGVDVPAQPFPKLNEAESMKAIYFGKQVYGALTWAIYIGLGGTLTFLTLRPAQLGHAAVRTATWVTQAPTNLRFAW